MSLFSSHSTETLFSSPYSTESFVFKRCYVCTEIMNIEHKHKYILLENPSMVSDVICVECDRLIQIQETNVIKFDIYTSLGKVYVNGKHIKRVKDINECKMIDNNTKIVAYCTDCDSTLSSYRNSLISAFRNHMKTTRHINSCDRNQII